MATQKAFRKGTDIEVQPGEIIQDFRGDDRVFERVSRDGGPGYSAKVLTEGSWALYAQCFPGIEVREPTVDPVPADLADRMVSVVNAELARETSR